MNPSAECCFSSSCWSNVVFLLDPCEVTVTGCEWRIKNLFFSLWFSCNFSATKHRVSGVASNLISYERNIWWRIWLDMSADELKMPFLFHVKKKIRTSYMLVVSWQIVVWSFSLSTFDVSDACAYRILYWLLYAQYGILLEYDFSWGSHDILLLLF